MANFVRTPESNFTNLPDFHYKPNYVTLPSSEGLRLAYIDEQSHDYNNTNSNVFLCLHGVPTWSYLYRKMIPIFLSSNKHHNNGVRIICPDFIGWGRSDKPTSSSKDLHNVLFHRKIIIELIQKLNLNNITLVIQDWGGLIGLTLPLDKNIFNKINRCIFFNTGIPDGSFPGEGFMQWRRYVGNTPDMNISDLIKRTLMVGTKKFDDESNNKYNVTKDELMGYDAPFVDKDYKLAVQMWPFMVPISADYNGMDLWRKAYFFWNQNRLIAERIMKKNFYNDKNPGKKKEPKFIQTFMAHGLRDMVFTTNQAYSMFRLMIPFSEQLNPDLGTALNFGGILWVPFGGHFLQEQGGDFVATKALKYFGDIPKDAVEYEWCVSQNTINLNSSKKSKKSFNCHILKLSLNNPPVNALSFNLMSDLTKLTTKFDINPYVRGFILTGESGNFYLQKRHTFCAGLDLNVFFKKDEQYTSKYFIQFFKLFGTLQKIRKPIINGINGMALAGGCLIALSCDYRIMHNYINNDNNKIKNIGIAMSESQYGMDVGILPFKLVESVCGLNNARFICQTGLTFCGNDAIKYGLIDELCDINKKIVLLNINDNINEIMDKKLLLQCINVLEYKYFNGKMEAAAMSKYYGRKEIIELTNDQNTLKSDTKGGINTFHGDTVQKYISTLFKNRKPKL